jgi:A nuclease of the HNH/ENDO VII superfamily with conserved WHH
MYDPGIGRWLTEDPIGFSAGDDNLYRYVGNAPTDSTDPSGLEHLPSSERGTWVEGSRGNGVFEYNNSAQNQAAGVAGARVRFSNNHIAIGGMPAAQYYGGSAEAASVQIPVVRGTDADFTAADNAMRARPGNANWQRPAGYTWNHAGEPGSRTMELVSRPFHRAVAHEGNASLARAGLRQAAAGVRVLSVFLTLRDACQMAGVLPPQETIVNATYFFTASDGSVYYVRYPSELRSFFEGAGQILTLGYSGATSPEIAYVAGPRAGRTQSISTAEATLYQLRGEELYGRVVGGTGIFSSPRRFIPGTLRATLPITETDVVRGTTRNVGYIDEDGEHRYPDNPVPGSLEDFRVNGA